METKSSSGKSPKIETATAIIAIAMSIATLLLLASLHFLSPEFDPSFRMVSEYAFGHYDWVLSLMFAAWGISSWALAAALHSRVKTRKARVGWWFLVIAGLGEAMASVFDVTHEVGHGIAGLLGVLGFPVAALLLSKSLSRLEAWRSSKKTLTWLAHLSWISVVLLIATLRSMTMQMIKANERSPASARTEAAAGGRARAGRLGGSPHHSHQLLVGDCGRLASEEILRETSK